MTTRTAIMGAVRAVSAAASMHPIISPWVGPEITLAVLLPPTVLSDFRLALLGKVLTLAMVAPSLHLIWGYGDMLSLGHGVFFGLGGYATAISLNMEPASGKLSGFMLWSGLTELPIFWEPFK